MFAIEPHLWLQQSFDPAWMLPLMLAISMWGYIPLFAAVIVLTGMLVNRRAGVLVLITALLMGSVVSLVKHSVDLPRPSDVDVRVLDEGRTGKALVAAGGGKDAWSLPDQDAVAAFRAQDGERDPGFISGHTGVTAALCMALVLLLQFRRWWSVAALLILPPAVMGLSRLYLGRHFLADVLAGCVAGWLVALLVYWAFSRLWPTQTVQR